MIDSILETVILRSIETSPHMIDYRHVSICLGQESLMLAWMLSLEVMRLSKRILTHELISV